MTSRASVLLPIVLALAVTGCGSTALRGGSQPLTGASGASAGQGSDAGLVSPAGGTSGSGGSVSGGATGSTGATGSGVRPGSTTGSPGAAGTTGSAPGSTGVASSGGVTAAPAVGSSSTAPIKLGVVGTDNGAIAGFFGKEGAAWDASPKKIVAYLNKTGGVGGRQLEATYFGADSAADASTNGQKACAALTEDSHVDVVVNVGMLGDVLPACLKQRGIAVFDAASWFADAATARQYPNWVVPNAIRLDRSVQAILQSAVARGTLKAGTKLGVVAESCPWASRVLEGTVKPLAKKYGVSVDSTSVKCISNILADLVPVQSDVQRGALRLKTAGATHILDLSQA